MRSLLTAVLFGAILLAASLAAPVQSPHPQNWMPEAERPALGSPVLP